MTKSARTDWRSIGCAAVLGAAIALPAGIFLGDHRAGRHAEKPGADRSATGDPSARSRTIYSPSFRKDPYVIAQQRRVAEALDLSCRQTSMHCAEARQAWQRIREAEAGQ